MHWVTVYDPKLAPINGLQIPESAEKSRKKTEASQSFEAVLQKELVGLGIKFSKHARERIARNGIHLNAEKLSRLGDAVAKARSKAARETLVLMEDIAFVVSVKNNTVITVVNGKRMRENVFTNIDSAVIV